MKRLREFGASPFLIVLALSLVLVPMCTPAGADECSAAVSPDLKVHIPVVQLDTGLYFLDLQYTPSGDGNIWFGIVGAGAVDKLQCETSALLSPVLGTYFLYVPSIAIGADTYWASLEYVPATATPQTKTYAGANGQGFKLTNFNREGIMEPLGTNRVPTSMMFSSWLTVDWGPGGPKLDLQVKTNQLSLGAPMATLTQPGWSFGAASGSLFVNSASCSFNNSNLITGTCRVSGIGIGTFSIDSITITEVNSSSPQITMKYHISFPPNQIVMNLQVCSQNICIPAVQWDEGTVINNWMPDKGSASGWNILPSLGSPCNGCGWPYAEKVYPDKVNSSGQLSLENHRTHIVLYE